MTYSFSFIEKIRHANVGVMLKKNRYAFLSVVIVAFYLYAAFFVLSFILTNTQRAFIINEQTTHNTITFDIASYEKIKHRLNEN